MQLPNATKIAASIAIIFVLAGCTTPADDPPVRQTKVSTFSTAPQYIIGPGDQLDIFVWRNPDLSTKVPVRPDGRISIPLVQDVQAAGKTSNQLADDIKAALVQFVKDPVVTVIVQGVQGTGNDRIAVVGEGMTPRTVAYRANLSVLDVMVEVGGLKEFSAGNSAKLLRKTATGTQEIPLRLDDLLLDGDPAANVILQPGDVIRIPERWF